MNLENTHEKESSMIAGKNDFHYSNRGRYNVIKI